MIDDAPPIAAIDQDRYALVKEKAGEATAPDESGTVSGAIASGRRAARRALR